MKELISIQTYLKAPKNQKNSFGNYNYRSCEDILEAVKPLLHENSCFLTITDDIVAVLDRVYVKATATITNGTDSISVSAFAREDLSKKGMSDSQITGSASSYARKYALSGLLLIDDNKDADTDEQHMQSRNAPKQEAKKATDAQIDKLIEYSTQFEASGEKEKADYIDKNIKTGMDYAKAEDMLKRLEG